MALGKGADINMQGGYYGTAHHNHGNLTHVIIASELIPRKVLHSLLFKLLIQRHYTLLSS
jgi:hypothetical protein